jgi:hypothetical protein
MREWREKVEQRWHERVKRRVERFGKVRESRDRHRFAIYKQLRSYNIAEKRRDSEEEKWRRNEMKRLTGE